MSEFQNVFLGVFYVCGAWVFGVVNYCVCQIVFQIEMAEGQGPFVTLHLLHPVCRDKLSRSPRAMVNYSGQFSIRHIFFLPCFRNKIYQKWQRDFQWVNALIWGDEA